MLRFKEYITFLLCIVLMLILSSMPLSLASHSIDHHHHSAQTHTTGICAWMCTAAETISTDSQIFSPNFSLLEIVPSSPLSSVHVPPQFFFPSRAPPFWFFSRLNQFPPLFCQSRSFTSQGWMVGKSCEWSYFRRRQESWDSFGFMRTQGNLWCEKD